MAWRSACGPTCSCHAAQYITPGTLLKAFQNRGLVPLIFDFFKKSLVIWGTVDLNGALSTASPSRGSRRLFSST